LEGLGERDFLATPEDRETGRRKWGKWYWACIGRKKIWIVSCIVTVPGTVAAFTWYFIVLHDSTLSLWWLWTHDLTSPAGSLVGYGSNENTNKRRNGNKHFIPVFHPSTMLTTMISRYERFCNWACYIRKEEEYLVGYVKRCKMSLRKAGLFPP
jgi:hypothetical protein